MQEKRKLDESDDENVPLFDDEIALTTFCTYEQGYNGNAMLESLNMAPPSNVAGNVSPSVFTNFEEKEYDICDELIERNI